MDEQQTLIYRRAFELLCCCARTHLLPHHAERIERLLQEEVPLEYLIQLSSVHGVRPLLLKNLLEESPASIPGGMRKQLLHLTHATSTYNIFLAKELGRVMDLLNASEIPAMALKGPALAQVAYGDIKLRPFVDLDILIREEDFSEVNQLLMEDGYIPHVKVSGYSRIRRQLYLWQVRQYPFRRGTSVFHLDLHTDVMPPLYNYAVNFETLWERSEVISIAETPVHSCEPEDLLQILCFHGAKNRWETLKYICDVAELIQARETLDWDLLMRRARQMRGERILFLGLHLAHSLLGACLPREVLLGIEREQIVKRIAAQLFERLPFHLHLGVVGLKDRFRFQLAIQDTLATKARYGGFALIRRIAAWLQPGIE